VLISLASFAIMLPVIQGREMSWPIGMLILPLAAVPLLWAFAVAERRRDRRDASALLPPDLMQHRSFAVGLVVLLLVFSAPASLFLVLNYTLLIGYHWSPVRAALAGFGFPVGIIAATGVAQRFAAAYSRRLVQTGLSVMAAGIVVLIWMFRIWGMDVVLAPGRADPGDGTRHGLGYLHHHHPGACRRVRPQRWRRLWHHQRRRSRRSCVAWAAAASFKSSVKLMSWIVSPLTLVVCRKVIVWITFNDRLEWVSSVVGAHFPQDRVI
jgi:hypothetical protein